MCSVPTIMETLATVVLLLLKTDMELEKVTQFKPTGRGNSIISTADMYISYNGMPNLGGRSQWLTDMANALNDEPMHETSETALRTNDKWYILMGDHRGEYQKLFPDKKKCLAYYKKQKAHLRSNWSTD